MSARISPMGCSYPFHGVVICSYGADAPFFVYDDKSPDQKWVRRVAEYIEYAHNSMKL